MRVSGLARFVCALSLSLVLANSASAQTLDQKLLSKNVLVEADLNALVAFDSLALLYDLSEVSVDTTVVINDSLWMSILWMSDTAFAHEGDGSGYRNDSACEHVFMMTIDPISLRVKALRQIRTECDVDPMATDRVYFAHEIMSPTVVQVVSSRPCQWTENGVLSEELIPFEERTFKVMPVGEIVDTGVRAIAEPRLWKP